MKLGIIFYLCLISQIAFCQISETTANALKCILLEEKISDKIFFNYENEWEGAYHPSTGNYAFICPDTTFQKVYQGILSELPYSIATDGYLNLRKLYKDSARSIYINGGLNFELFIVFKEISVSSEKAIISFFTTSRLNQERFKDRYVLVTGCLRKNKSEWEVVKTEISPIDWVEYFPMKFFGR